MTNDTKDREDSTYKDDKNAFGASSDTAAGRPADRYAGQTQEEAGGAPRPPGSQDEWQQPGSPQSAAPDREGEVKSRSADPGQGSYGGFKDEGPATPEGDPKGPRSGEKR